MRDMTIASISALSFAALAVWPAAAEVAHHQAGAVTLRSGQTLAKPWNDRKGSFRGRAFVSYLQSSSGFDSGGAKTALKDNGRFQGTTFNLFGEYAVSDRWNAAALVPLQDSRLRTDISRDHWTSLGDVFGWARYRLDQKGAWTPSMAAGVKLPGTYKSVSGLGDGQTDLDLQGFASRVVGKGGYGAFNAGYRYRAGGISDEVVFGAQLGWAPARAWLLLPGVSGAFGVGSGVPKDFVNLGLSAFRTVGGDWSAFASYNRVVAGKNTSGADVWSFGMAFR